MSSTSGRDALKRSRRTLDVMSLHRRCLWALLACLGGTAYALRPDVASHATLFGALAGVAALELAIVVAPSTLIGPRPRALAELLLPVLGLGIALAVAGPVFNTFAHWYALPVMAAFAHLRVRDALIVLVVAILCAVSLFVLSSDATDLSSAGLEAGEAAILFVIAAVFAKRFSSRLETSGESARAMAYRDELTSLLNLRTFMEAAEGVHERAIDTKVPYAILMIDVNGLHSINERYGQDAGDRAIALVADAVLRLAAGDEILGRFAADKFVLLLPRLSGSRADDTAQRIRNAVFATTMNVGVRVVRIKSNVGIAKYPVNGMTVEALLRFAEDDLLVDRKGRDRPKQMPVYKRRSGTSAS